MNSASYHSSNDASVDQLNFSSPSVPLSYLQSGQFLALTAESQGGLIIQKGCYATFIGPGAAVGGYFDTKCTTVYAAGAVQFCVPQTYLERQQAFQKRITYINALQQITVVQAPLRRAHLVISQLDQWLGVRELKAVPHELIARLVGVHPRTVEVLLRNYFVNVSQDTLVIPK